MEFDVILFDWGGTLAEVARQDELYRRGAEAAVRAACGSADEAAFRYLIRRVAEMEKEAAADPELREADFTKELAGWAQAFPGRVRPERLPAALEAIGREWVGSLDALPGAIEAVRTNTARALADDFNRDAILHALPGLPVAHMVMADIMAGALKDIVAAAKQDGGSSTNAN